MPQTFPVLILLISLISLVLLGRHDMSMPTPGPTPGPEPAPGPQHTLASSIAAKKSADSALATAQAASAAADETLRTDLTSSGPVFLAGDTATDPGTFEIWRIDAVSGDPTMTIVHDATTASVPGPAPDITPPSASEAASLAALAAAKQQIDGIAAPATLDVPPPPL